MPEFKIKHITRYLFDNEVYQLANLIKLFPIEDATQKLIMQKLEVTGNPDISFHADYWGNKTGVFTIPFLHGKMLEIISEISVATLADDENGKHESETSFSKEALNNDLNHFHKIDFLINEKFRSQQEVKKVCRIIRDKTRLDLEMAMGLSDYIYSNFSYKAGLTNVESTIDDVWELKAGVCQDFAHLLLAMLRFSGIPARYVSGYICPNRNGMRGDGATHAWVEAYLPETGWLGIDPTNNCLAKEKHVRVAIGRNFADCSPVKGTFYGGANHILEVSVSVAYEDGEISDKTEQSAPAPNFNYSYRPEEKIITYTQQQQQQ